MQSRAGPTAECVCATQPFNNALEKLPVIVQDYESSTLEHGAVVLNGGSKSYL